MCFNDYSFVHNLNSWSGFKAGLNFWWISPKSTWRTIRKLWRQPVQNLSDNFFPKPEFYPTFLCLLDNSSFPALNRSLKVSNCPKKSFKTMYFWPWKQIGFKQALWSQGSKNELQKKGLNLSWENVFSMGQFSTLKVVCMLTIFYCGVYYKRKPDF